MQQIILYPVICNTSAVYTISCIDTGGSTGPIMGWIQLKERQWTEPQGQCFMILAYLVLMD